MHTANAAPFGQTACTLGRRCPSCASDITERLMNASPRRDLATGTFLAAYKGGGAAVGGLALLGRDHIVAAQPASPALHFWTWHRVSVLHGTGSAVSKLVHCCRHSGRAIAHILWCLDNISLSGLVTTLIWGPR